MKRYDKECLDLFSQFGWVDLEQYTIPTHTYIYTNTNIKVSNSYTQNEGFLITKNISCKLVNFKFVLLY